MPQTEQTAGRRTYVVDKDIVDRREATVACEAVLDLLRPFFAAATIDAYSDYDDELPPRVGEAQDWLRARGRARGSGDPGCAIELDPTDEEHWAVLRTYAPWSINVDVADNIIIDAGSVIANLHDCGYSITADLTDSEASELAATLASLAPVVLLEVALARNRAEKAASRAARRTERHRQLRRLFRRR